jgi:phospholipid transport system substrate-binding protein
MSRTKAINKLNKLLEDKMKKRLAIITVILCLAFPLAAFAGAALDAVKGNVDKVLDVLRDPSLKSESSKQIKKNKIRAIGDNMFDFTELSKRTLAVNWSKFTPEQQKEFISLYKDLLADTYADKIVAYTDEKIVFTKEVSLTEKTIEVQSTVIRKTQEIPIYYRVIKENGSWLVYDVVIEGVSLVNNYRTQFREILSNKPPTSLIETLKKKLGRA